MNIELVSDKPTENELQEVQSEKAKQKLESCDGKALTIDNSDLNEICESYNCRFVPEIDSGERIKKVLGSNEINAELNKLKMTLKTNLLISIKQLVNSEMSLFRFPSLQ